MWLVLVMNIFAFQVHTYTETTTKKNNKEKKMRLDRFWVQTVVKSPNSVDSVSVSLVRTRQNVGIYN